MSLKNRIGQLEKKHPVPDPMDGWLETLPEEDLYALASLCEKMEHWQETGEDLGITEEEKRVAYTHEKELLQFAASRGQKLDNNDIVGV